MRLTILAFLSSVSAVAFPPALTLVAEGGNTVLTDGQHALVAPDLASSLDILTLHSGEQGTLTYNGQSLFVHGNNEPLGLSAEAPQDAATGFGLTDDHYLTWHGQEGFGLGPKTGDKQEITWLGQGNNTLNRLWVKECRGC